MTDPIYSTTNKTHRLIHKIVQFTLRLATIALAIPLIIFINKWEYDAEKDAELYPWYWSRPNVNAAITGTIVLGAISIVVDLLELVPILEPSGKWNKKFQKVWALFVAADVSIVAGLAAMFRQTGAWIQYNNSVAAARSMGNPDVDLIFAGRFMVALISFRSLYIAWKMVIWAIYHIKGVNKEAADRRMKMAGAKAGKAARRSEETLPVYETGDLPKSEAGHAPEYAEGKSDAK